MPFKDKEKAAQWQRDHRNREKDKAYRELHRDTALAYDRAYKENHRERLLQQAKDYYYSHREAKLAYQKEYGLTHKDKVRAYHLKWQRAHAEKCRVRRLTWQRNNPEKVKEYNLRRHAAKMGVATERIDYKQITIRDRMICGICHKRVASQDLSFDHIVPLSLGGPHFNNNIQVAHRYCNASRGAGRIPAQMRLGL